MTSQNNERILPLGLNPNFVTNIDDYYRVNEEPSVMAIGSQLESHEFDAYVRDHAHLGLSIGALLLWHRYGPGYDIFPVLRVPEVHNETS